MGAAAWPLPTKVAHHPPCSRYRKWRRGANITNTPRCRSGVHRRFKDAKFAQLESGRLEPADATAPQLPREETAGSPAMRPDRGMPSAPTQQLHCRSAHLQTAKRISCQRDALGVRQVSEEPTSHVPARKHATDENMHMGGRAMGSTTHHGTHRNNNNYYRRTTRV